MMKSITFWSLNKIIALLLLGGMAMFLTDIRWEHRVELGRQWQTWIPIVYSALMIIVGAVCVYFWESWGRKVLFAGFALSLIVGALGFFFHGQGQSFEALFREISAWTIPPGTNGGIKVGSEPPIMAPLSFIGLGLLGILVCSKRFRAET